MGEGIPLHGDRAAWDTENYADRHAKDIEDETYLVHKPSSGISGTLTLDDGANWRVTLTFVGGVLTGQTTGASVSATATWT